MPTRLNWTVIAAVVAFCAVAAGAFGAHALRARLTPQDLAVFETAVRYQFYHAFALIACDAVIAQGGDARWSRWAGRAFCAGIVLFSGSLYVLVLSNVRRWGIVTPFGGLAFLVGWACLAAAAWRGR